MWRSRFKQSVRPAALLALACAVSSMLLIPYLLELRPELRELIQWPMWAFALAQGFQGGLMCGLLALVGLTLGRERGLRAPWVEAWSRGESGPPVPRGVWRVVALGAGVGALILGVDQALQPWMPDPIGATPPSPAWWRGLLASFYGGIAEEVITRLFVMTLLVTLWHRLSRRATPSPRAYWFGIIAAALIFGVLHLPAAAGIWPLTGLVIARVITLNAIAGITFGWLFKRHGLEAAMLAHFSADILLHVIPQLLA